MSPVFQRLFYGWTIIFFGCVALVTAPLFWYDTEPPIYNHAMKHVEKLLAERPNQMTDEEIGALWRKKYAEVSRNHPRWLDDPPVPKGRALLGLAILTVAAAFILARNSTYDSPWVYFNGILLGIGLMSGFALGLIGLSFGGPHPMRGYATVRHINSDGFIESDEVYLRSAPVVKMLEKEGPRTSFDGGLFRIEGYLYSPRIGLVLGASLGEGRGSPDFGYELNGIAAWLFGVRAACEAFAFSSVNFTPAILAYALYCHYKKKPPNHSLAIQPLRALFLLAPFCLGLIPILGP